MSENIKNCHKRMERDMFTEKEHYKMYKSGDHWMTAKIATIAGVALFSTMILGGMNSKANADTVNQSSVTPATTQVAKASSQTSKNAANNSAQPTNFAVNTQSTGTQNSQTANSSSASQGTGTQSTQTAKGIDVTVPHNDLDNAVSNAKKDGVQVTQGATQNKTATAGQPADNAEQQIKQDYQNQTNAMNQADSQQKQVNSARATANDHSALDNEVANAKKDGVTVSKQADQNINGSASDASKVQSQISSDYQNEINDIKKAEQQQQQYNQQYQDALNQYQSLQNQQNNGDPTVAKVVDKVAYDQPFDYNGDTGNEPTITGGNVTSDSADLSGMNSKKGWFVPTNDQTSLNVTWKDAATDKSSGRKLNIEMDLSNFVNRGQNSDINAQGQNLPEGVWIYSNPIDAVTSQNIAAYRVKLNVTYADNGQAYDKPFYVNVGSLNSTQFQNSKDTSNRAEYVTPISNIKSSYINTNSSVDANEQPIYGPASKLDQKGFYQQKDKTVATSDIVGQGVMTKEGITFFCNNGCVFDTGVTSWNANVPVKGRMGVTNPWQMHLMITTQPAAKAVTPPTLQHATANYHYDVASLPNVQASYHYDDLKVTPVNVKDVAAGTIQGKDSVSIDGKDVVQGQKLTFTLTPSALPANRTDDTNSFQIVDKLDPNFDYTGYKAFLGNTDATNDFTPALTKDANGQWTLTLTANSAFDDAINKDKSSSFAIPVFDLYGTALKGGTPIKNTYTEVINSNDWNSNTVSVTPENPGTPVKTVVNADGQDANNGNVARGDALIYHVDMDLTNQAKDTVLTPDTVAKGLWITDSMPNGVTVNASGIRVNSADGKDITSQFTITDENGQIKVAAKDPEAIIKAYGGTKLDITIPTTVNDDFTGDIKNTAQQNTFGNITTSNTVVDHVPPMNPTKDVVVDLGNQNSLNGQTIALGSTFDYKLNSSTRSANYVGKTTEWGMQDHLDMKHDEFTGQWQVIADHPFVLKDGTTIKAGSDISKYFTMTYNTQTGEFDVEANKDFLDIMNLPANKKTEQGWSVFFQCKRIATGTVYNTFSETYNGKVKNSNTVKTTTPEPKKPEAPKSPTTPQPQKVVEKVTPAPVVEKAVPAQPVLAAPAPVKETPAPEKQAMPQTGESENDEAAIIGLATLGVVGMMGLGLRKKRYEE